MGMRLFQSCVLEIRNEPNRVFRLKNGDRSRAWVASPHANRVGRNDVSVWGLCLSSVRRADGVP